MMSRLLDSVKRSVRISSALLVLSAVIGGSSQAQPTDDVNPKRSTASEIRSYDQPTASEMRSYDDLTASELQSYESPSDIVVGVASKALSPSVAASNNETLAGTIRVCPSSEIYEISTRHLPDHFCAINENSPCFEVNAWNCGRWQSQSLDNALNSHEKLTIVYVHGNFMERDNARERVRILDCCLKRQANEDYRLLLFSWPSMRERKPLRDAADNATVAEMESLYLAWILRELRSHSRVSVIGFSYGARTVTGALHLDAGGCIPGYQSLSTPGPRSSPYRLGLVAPAVDKTWLTSNGKHSQALAQVDGFVNLYNSRDPVLRRFRFIDRVTRPIAGGLTGFDGIYDPRSITPFVGVENTKQYDCGAIIGTTHAEKSYIGECPYFRILLDNVLWNEVTHATTCSRCNAK
jgi:pimeloyl-ACP methyl ester carboxylesterase